jgi:hypothetical protein
MGIVCSLLKDDDELYEESMNNAYFIVIGELTFNDLLEYNGCSLPFSPKEDIDEETINDMINYFVSIEEYEKCHKLKTIKEKGQYKKNFLNL